MIVFLIPESTTEVEMSRREDAKDHVSNPEEENALRPERHPAAGNQWDARGRHLRGTDLAREITIRILSHPEKVTSDAGTCHRDDTNESRLLHKDRVPDAVPGTKVSNLLPDKESNLPLGGEARHQAGEAKEKVLLAEGGEDLEKVLKDEDQTGREQDRGNHHQGGNESLQEEGKCPCHRVVIDQGNQGTPEVPVIPETREIADQGIEEVSQEIPGEEAESRLADTMDENLPVRTVDMDLGDLHGTGEMSLLEVVNHLVTVLREVGITEDVNHRVRNTQEEGIGTVGNRPVKEAASLREVLHRDNLEMNGLLLRNLTKNNNYNNNNKVQSQGTNNTNKADLVLTRAGCLEKTLGPEWTKVDHHQGTDQEMTVDHRSR